MSLRQVHVHQTLVQLLSSSNPQLLEAYNGSRKLWQVQSRVLQLRGQLSKGKSR